MPVRYQVFLTLIDLRTSERNGLFLIARYPDLQVLMRFADLMLLLGVVTCMGVGQILFKSAARIAPQSLSAWFNDQNLKFLLIAGAGILLYGLTSIAWIYALRSADLSRAYPITALSFVIVPLLSVYFFHEQIAPGAWLGMLLILVGVWMIARA